MDERLVAKHAMLYEASPDNDLLLFIDEPQYKYSSCMKSRFCCISVSLLQVEDTEDGTV